MRTLYSLSVRFYAFFDGGLKILLVSAQLNVLFKFYNKKYFGSNVMGSKVL